MVAASLSMIDESYFEFLCGYYCSLCKVLEKKICLFSFC